MVRYKSEGEHNTADGSFDLLIISNGVHAANDKHDVDDVDIEIHART